MALRDLRMCNGCLKKMQQIDRLKRERVQLRAQVARLKETLGRQDRHIHAKPFGSSASSSKGDDSGAPAYPAPTGLGQGAKTQPRWGRRP